jgi:hypothetical protein
VRSLAGDGVYTVGLAQPQPGDRQQTMACVRILIADDHELVRQRLRARLAARPAWEVCGEAADAVTFPIEPGGGKPERLMVSS